MFLSPYEPLICYFYKGGFQGGMNYMKRRESRMPTYCNWLYSTTILTSTTSWRQNPKYGVILESIKVILITKPFGPAMIVEQFTYGS